MTKRSVTSHLEVFVAEESDLAMAIAVADGHEREDEQLLVSLDGTPINANTEGKLCFLENVGQGLLLIDYRATVLDAAKPATATLQDIFRYIRPSRYCESDRLGPLARAEFGGLKGADLLAGVSSWVAYSERTTSPRGSFRCMPLDSRQWIFTS